MPQPQPGPLIQRLRRESAIASAAVPANNLFSAGFETGLRFMAEFPGQADQILAEFREWREEWRLTGNDTDAPLHAMRHIAGLPCTHIAASDD